MLLHYFNSLELSLATAIFSFPFSLPNLFCVCKFWVVLSAFRKMCSRNILTLLPFCQCSVQIEEHLEFVMDLMRFVCF